MPIIQLLACFQDNNFFEGTMMENLAQKLYPHLDESISKAAEEVRDRVQISQKARRKLFRKKLYHWFQSNVISTN